MAKYLGYITLVITTKEVEADNLDEARTKMVETNFIDDANVSDVVSLEVDEIVPVEGD